MAGLDDAFAEYDVYASGKKPATKPKAVGLDGAFGEYAAYGENAPAETPKVTPGRSLTGAEKAYFADPNNTTLRTPSLGELLPGPSISTPQQPEGNIANALRGMAVNTGVGMDSARLNAQSWMTDLLDLARKPTAEGRALQQDRYRKYQAAQGRSDAVKPEYNLGFTNDLYNATTSLAQTAPSLALGVATRNPVLGLGMAGMQSADYLKYKGRGATVGEASLGAAGEGAVEILTEVSPMGFLIGKYGTKGAKEFLSGYLIREGVGEQAATLAQDAIDTAIANPEKTWGEYLKERPNAAYQTALATLMTGGAVTAPKAVAEVFGGAKPAKQQPEPTPTPTPTPAATGGGLDATLSEFKQYDPDATADPFTQQQPRAVVETAQPTPNVFRSNRLGDAIAQPQAVVETPAPRGIVETPWPHGVVETVPPRGIVETAQPKYAEPPAPEAVDAPLMDAPSIDAAQEAPATPEADTELRTLTEDLIRQMRDAKQLNLDRSLRAAIDRIKNGGINEKPAYFTKLAKEFEKQGDQKTAGMLGRVAETLKAKQKAIPKPAVPKAPKVTKTGVMTSDEFSEASRKEFLSMVKKMGGVSTEFAADITGEPANQANRMLPGFFSTRGNNLDMVARKLHEAGYISDEEYNDVDGGIERTSELLGQALAKEFVGTPEDHQRLAELEAREADAAAELQDETERRITAEILGETPTEDEFAALFDGVPNNETQDRADLARAQEQEHDAAETSRIESQAGEAVTRGTTTGEESRAGVDGRAAAQSQDGEQAQGFNLDQQTETDIAEREAAVKKREAELAKKEADAEAKAKADRERGDFALTGSDRAADGNANQGDIFGQQSKPDQETVKPVEPEAEPEKIEDFGENESTVSPNTGYGHSALFQDALEAGRRSVKAFSDFLNGDAFFGKIDDLLNIPIDARATGESTDAVDRGATADKGLLKGVLADTKALRNILGSNPVFKHGLSGVDAKTQRLVFSHVLSLSKNLKVLNSVVELIPVDVVNNLGSQKLSADMFFNDPSVFKRAITGKLSLVVPASGHMADSLVRAITLAGAEVSARGVAPDLKRPSQETDSTGRAFDGNFSHEQDNTRNDGQTKETDSGIAMFSRGNPEAAGGRAAILQDELDNVVNRVSANWKRAQGFDGGTVRSVDAPADLPAAILRQADAQNVPHEEIKGVLHNGHVYLVRSNLTDALDAELTLFHEAYGHLGARMFFGPEAADVQKAFVALWDRVGHLDGVRKMADKFGVRAELEPYIRSIQKADFDLDTKRKIIMDELLAHIQGRGDQTLIEKVKAYVGALRVALRKAAKRLGLNGIAQTLDGYTDTELLWNLKQMRDAVVSGKTGKGNGTMFHRVWHGTPHKWDAEPGFPNGRPRLDKMGSGEGNQAYGWGWYSAEAQSVAGSYASQLRNPVELDGKKPDTMRMGFAETAIINYFQNRLAAKIGDERARQQTGAWAKHHGQINGDMTDAEIDSFIERLSEGKGNLYQHDIPDDVLPKLLDWDKPLSEQTNEVKKAIRPAFEKILRSQEDGNDLTVKLKQTIRNTLFKNVWPDDMTGKEFYFNLEDMFGDSDKAASEYLASIGIVGNRYLDGNSRNKPLKDIKREFLAELPEDAEISEVEELLGTGAFSAKNEAVLNALKGDDWLGFDYPSQAVSAALGNGLRNFDASTALLQAVASAQEGGTYNYVIWDQPTLDRVTMIERNGETLFARRTPAGPNSPQQPIKMQNRPGFNTDAETRVEEVQRKHQDKMNRWAKVQRQITEQGGTVGLDQDVYHAMERMTGRAADRIDQFTHETVRPLLKRASDLKTTLEEVGTYLMALGAKDRNAYIQTIRQDMPDNGSGLSNQQAAKIIADYQTRADFAEFDALARDFQKLTERKLKVLVGGGVIDQQHANNLKQSFGFYVPYKGFETIDEDGNRTGGNGPGYSTPRRFTKQAFGRVSKAGQVVENIIRDYEQAVILAEKSNVGRYVRNLAQTNPDPTLWTVDQPPSQPVMKGGIVSLMQKGFDNQDEIRFIENGREVRIQLHDKLLAETYNNLGDEPMTFIMKAGDAVNRVLRQTYTQKNPAFILVNAVRDLQTGLAVMTGEMGAKNAIKALRHAPGAWKTASGEAMKRGSITGEWAQYMDAYRKTGAQTAYYAVGDIEAKQAKLEELLAREGGQSFIKQWKQHGGGLKGAKATVKLAAWRTYNNAVVDVIESLNGGFENMMRLAAFRQYIDDHGGLNGASKETMAEASRIAKNLTVNFNRKGEKTRGMNALYLFWNANVQGTNNLYRAATQTLHSNQVKAIYGGMVGLGFMMSLATGDEDDDLTPDYTKGTSIVIHIGGGKRIQIPLAYGLGYFVALGYEMGNLLQDRQTPIRTAMNIVGSALMHFSPLGNPIHDGKVDTTDVVIAATPTVLKPAVMSAANRNQFGYEVVPKYGDDSPDRPAMRTSTKGGVYDAAAGGLEHLGADVSPETLKMLTTFVTGGLGTFIGDSGTAGMVAAKGGFDAEKTPILKRFYGENDVEEHRARFYNLAEDVQEQAREQGKKQKEFFGSNEARNSVVDFKKQMKELRDRENEAHAKGKDKVVDAVQKKQIRLANEFKKEHDRMVSRGLIERR